MSISNNVSNSIPFLDLVTPHVELEQELTEVFRKALRNAGFIGGNRSCLWAISSGRPRPIAAGRLNVRPRNAERYRWSLT